MATKGPAGKNSNYCAHGKKKRSAMETLKNQDDEQDKIGLAIVFEDGMQELSSDTSAEVCAEQCSTVLEWKAEDQR